MTARAFLTSTPVRNPDVVKRKQPNHIPVDTIVMLRADTKYVDAYDADGSSCILDNVKENTIKALALEFGDLFVEVRRGCLVRRSEIRSVATDAKNNAEVVLKCDMRVPLSRRRKAAILKLVAEYRATIQDRIEDSAEFENALDVELEGEHA